MLRLLDLSFNDPALNLALDEALLDAVEAGRLAPTLRVWESPTPFVVIGTAQVLRNEVRVENCNRDGVPILRRCSAGGCVLQGHGSFNYTLALPYALDPDYASLPKSYAKILGRIAGVYASNDVPLEHRGVSDLALGEHKVSGNAQRRRRNAFLHHGTLLHRVDTGAMKRYLTEPTDRPDYRGDRPHDRFLTTIPRPRHTIRDYILRAFPAVPGDPPASLLDRVRALATTKYRDDAWTYRR